MGATLFLFFVLLKTSLIIEIIFDGLVLIGRLLFNRYISKKKVNRFILSKVFILLFLLVYTLRDIWHQLLGCLKVVVAIFLFLH